MPLDFVILEEGGIKSGKPLDSAPLPPELHASLIEAARTNNLMVTGRFEDYYSDYQIDYEQLDQFNDEIDVLALAIGSSAMKDFAKHIHRVVNKAKQLKQGLHVLAD